MWPGTLRVWRGVRPSTLLMVLPSISPNKWPREKRGCKHAYSLQSLSFPSGTQLTSSELSWLEHCGGPASSERTTWVLDESLLGFFGAREILKIHITHICFETCFRCLFLEALQLLEKLNVLQNRVMANGGRIYMKSLLHGLLGKTLQLLAILFSITV